ncbi:Six-hairpin glycosidase-like protein [Lentinula lateritia]|uniref:Six-hairpin glycosidase-like protein n=1 Tax=Lentinula lateritia TaxID=40482 RepID=A0ABQ8VCF9_9AGAR|nr:Six-hairpin glycosidase-like protein [Lentinula lateritia]
MSILKECLFGVTGHQGNHGKDIKELYYYHDSAPSHSYMKFLYKYPQCRYLYKELVTKNQNRSRDIAEYEILDSDAFDEDRYWDVFMEVSPRHIYARIFSLTLHSVKKPLMPSLTTHNCSGIDYITAKHPDQPKTHLYCLPSPPPVGPDGNFDVDPETEAVEPELLFTGNNTNFSRLYGGQNETPYVKDAFHNHIIPSHCPPPPEGDEDFFSHKIRFRARVYSTARSEVDDDEKDLSIEDEGIFDDAVEAHRQEADKFYNSLVFGPISDDFKQIMHQALGGMLWTKQYYKFIQKEWLEGDPAQPPPPPERKFIRNRGWRHMHVADVLFMPNKQVYLLFAAWDTAFHCIPLAVVDPAYAKKQLDLMTREWYMKPDGQLPAYKWNFGDVNPPVHAWATFRVFKIERKLCGRKDLEFLERVFQKLLLNFTWWVNRKDAEGNNVFEGGFLGLDNIGLFNRSEPLPTGGNLRQADGTAWMAFYCLNMQVFLHDNSTFRNVPGHELQAEFTNIGDWRACAKGPGLFKNFADVATVVQQLPLIYLQCQHE